MASRYAYMQALRAEAEANRRRQLAAVRARKALMAQGAQLRRAQGPVEHGPARRHA